MLRIGSSCSKYITQSIPFKQFGYACTRSYARPLPLNKRKNAKSLKETQKKQNAPTTQSPGKESPTVIDAVKDEYLLSLEEHGKFGIEDIISKLKGGQFFEFPAANIEKINSAYLERSKKKSLGVLGRPQLLFRSVFDDIIASMKSAGSNVPHQSIIIDGDSGSGKSSAISTVVNAALNSNWMVFYIPAAFTLINAKYSYEKAESNLVTYSQNELTSELLRNFGKLNHTLLKNLKITQSYNFGGDKISSGSTLTELIHLSKVDQGAHSPAVFDAVFSQLQSFVDRQPLLIAIDGINCFNSNSQYRNKDRSLISADQLLLVKRLQKLFEEGTGMNGLSIGASCLSNAYLSQTSPQIEGAKRVVLPPLSFDEIDSVMRHFISVYHLTQFRDSASQSRLKNYLFQLTEGKPADIPKAFIPFLV